MTDQSDWRLHGQEDYLHGAILAMRRYRIPPDNPDWDHDHCEFCNAKFMVEDKPKVLHEGYCTEDEYYWICPQCFADFKDRFEWQIKTSE